MSAFKAACVQLRSTDDVQENIRTASALIREAAGQGAQFIGTPENTTLMAPDGGAKIERTFTEDADPALPAFRALAEELGIWLLIGSLAIKVDGTKTANRSYLINPKGGIAASLRQDPSLRCRSAVRREISRVQHRRRRQPRRSGRDAMGQDGTDHLLRSALSRISIASSPRPAPSC